MATSSQRQSKSRSSWQNIKIILLGLVFIWLITSSIRMVLTYTEARNNRVSAENQKIEIEQDIAEIHEKIEQIKTQDGIEEHIRLKYPLVKDGERVLVISSEENKEQESKSLWQRIFDNK